MEERVSTKGNSQQIDHHQTQSWSMVDSRLLTVREAAKKDKTLQFNNLFHHLTEDLLIQSYRKLKRHSAAGCDKVTWQDYAENEQRNIACLYQRLQTAQYKPKPARRVFIAKEDGSERPLSIQCLEDKIVQQAVVHVLNQIYEVDFMGFSYGFRPERSQHDALDSLYMAIMKKKVNWVLDLDISKFFDTVEHGWLLNFIQHRVSDKRILRLIRQWITVGILDEHGHRVKATIGTPQGAVVSPLLANIYLHYCFDIWLDAKRKKVRGDITIIRYADDAVLGFQHYEEACACLAGLNARLKRFGLMIHPNKTRLIRFGRFAILNHKERGLKGRPETFDFLGFTHYMDKTRTGDVKLKRKTKRQRFAAHLKRIKCDLRKRLHQNPVQTGFWLRRVVQGHINYYGVPFNSKAVGQFVFQVKRLWLKMLRRRSQRSNMPWSRFNYYVKYFIPNPRIVHPYPDKRFYVKHPR